MAWPSRKKKGAKAPAGQEVAAASTTAAPAPAVGPAEAAAGKQPPAPLASPAPKKEAVLPESSTSPPPPATGAGAAAHSAPNTPSISLVSPAPKPDAEEEAGDVVLEQSVVAERRAGHEGRGWCFPFQNGISGLLFLGHTVLFLWLALGQGLTNIKLFAYENEGRVSYPAAGIDADILRALEGLAIVTAAGAGYAFLWALLLVAAPAKMTSVTYHASLLSCAAGVGVAGWLNAWGLVGVGTAIIVAHIGYNYCMAERRPFVNGTFAVAAAALRASPAALLLALLNAGTQIAWLLLWAVAAYGWGIDRSHAYIKIGDVVFNDPEACLQDPSLAQCNCIEMRQGTPFKVTGMDYCENLKTYDANVNWAKFLPLLLSLAWGAHVLKALSGFTTAAIVGHWWHHRLGRFRALSVYAKGLSTSFGSLCLSALVVVVLRVVRLLVFVPMPPQRRRWATRPESGASPTVTSPTVLGIGLAYDPDTHKRRLTLSLAARGMMQLLAIWGRYAVAYCGLRSTAPQSDALSLTRAVDALSDDVFAQGATGLTDAAVNDLGEGSLRALALATGIATGVAAVGFGEAHTLDATALHALAGIGFLGGFFVALTILSALDAAVAAVVVQGVVGPEGIKGNHPKEAKALEGVWAKEGLRLGPQERKTQWPEGGKKNKGGDVEAQA